MKKILLIVSFVTLSSCKYDGTFSRVKNLKESKEKVEATVNDELTSENQALLRNYFGQIKNVIYEIKNSSKIQSYVHKKFSRFFQNSICDEILLDDDSYQKIMGKCQVSGFYICSEEVREYEALLTVSKEIFSESELSKIIEEKKCKEKLTNLGVINE